MGTQHQRLVASGLATLALAIVAVAGCTTGGSSTASGSAAATGSTATPQGSPTASGSPVSPTPSPVATPNAVTGTVWVADEYGNSITVIDAATNERITTLTGIEGPHNLQVAPDGKTVWAVSGHESMAVMIDATTYAVHGAVATGKEP